LVAYGDSRDVLLAPIGWACEAQDSDPGIIAATSPDGQEEIDLEVDRTDSSDPLFLACPLFASAQQQNRPTDATCAPPPSAEVDRAVTSELVSFTDPPQVSGTGLTSGGDFESDGLVWYHSDGQHIQAARISCTLSPADHDLCDPILSYFRSTLPAPAAGATPAELASFQPSAPPTQPPTAPPAGDCAIRLTDADATVVVRGAGTSGCTAAKHALLGIGVFYTVDPGTATRGLRLICSGPVMGLSGKVEVWDLGGATYATFVCQGWNLVSP
jgi:hypothetical protein